jgi:hypothetical protein
VDESEIRRNRREVRLAPLDHPKVEVDSKVPPWPGPLLNQSPREPSTTGSEVEHTLEYLLGQVRVHETAGPVVEALGTEASD